MRGRALLITFILVVAAPDRAPVLVCAVPDLAAIEGTAISANDA